jgi:hypothetical protein
MIMLLYPIAVILAVSFLARSLLPRVFKTAGWRGGGNFILEERTGSILFLLCSAVMAGIAYWYPWYLCTYYSAPDDRYGFAMLPALPFYFIGPGIAGVALFRLVKVLRGNWSVPNVIFAMCGSLLALVGVSPLIMIGCRLFSSS